MASLFCRYASEQPVIQIAFQYTVVVPPEELSASRLASASRYDSYCIHYLAFEQLVISETKLKNIGWVCWQRLLLLPHPLFCVIEYR